MAGEKMALFRPYSFKVGQKIFIDGGHRKGHWEVIDVGARSVTLRCPISHREVEWHHFCFYVEEREDIEWPGKES